MAPTYSNGQEMVSIYLIKIKITTKFFKFASVSLTVRDRPISSKFSTDRVSVQCTFGNFQKNFPVPTYGGHFEFSSKMEKHKFAYLLKCAR